MAVDLLAGYVPADLGLDPAQFPAYRTHPVTGDPIQLDVVEFCAYSEKRFACASAPVGIGKSLIALSIARLTGLRCAIVVPYKGLQDQYADTGAVLDIRGRSNYDCVEHTHLDCRDGIAAGCRAAKLRAGCAYDCQVDVAREADIVVTNYDYWFTKNNQGPGGLQRRKEQAELHGPNPFQLLILDEGDLAPRKLADYLAITIGERDIKRWVDVKSMGDDAREWREMLKTYAVVDDIKTDIAVEKVRLATPGHKATKEQLKKLQDLERTLEKFERIQDASDDEWVIEKHEGTRYGRQWTFDIVWPGRYAERYLFCGIPKVVVLSGTLTVKDLTQMGVKKEDREYRQWGGIFPLQNQPTYLLAPRKKNADGEWVNINVGMKSTEADLLAWVELMDTIIDGRLDRKGLIQTTSYKYQSFIMENSRHKDLMVGNTNDPDSESAEEIAEWFYTVAPPKILVSPSFGRGWNFSYSRAEYCIISKCPFLPLMSKVSKARLERDADYGNAITMKTTEQGNGRLKRAVDDRGETFLTDGSFSYFLFMNKRLGQEWFVGSIRKVLEVPKTPRKLEK